MNSVHPPVTAGSQVSRVLDERLPWLGYVALHSVVVIVAVTYLVEPGNPLLGRIISAPLAVWSVFRLARPRLDVTWELADLLVIGVYLVCTPLLLTADRLNTVRNPAHVIGLGVAVACAIGTPARVSVLVLTASLAAAAIGIFATPGAGPPWMIFEWNYIVVGWVLAAFCRVMAKRAAALADDILNRSGNAEIARTVAAARYRAARKQWAALHDTAASTLLMVGQGAAPRKEVLAEQINRDLETISELTALVEMTDDVVDVVPRLISLCTSAHTPARIRGRESVPVAAALADAIEGATREALANVDRHAQASEAIITVSPAAVSIVDDGIGFDPESGAVSRRFGIRNSIEVRMNDAGGHAYVASSPGAGTRIELRWDVGRSETASTDFRTDAAAARRLLRGIGAGLLVAAVMVVTVQPPHFLIGGIASLPMQVALVSGLTVCLAVAGIGAWTQLPGAVIWAAYGLLLAVMLVHQAVLISDRAALSNWALWSLGWTVIALLYRRPPRQSVTALIAFVVIGLFAALVFGIASPVTTLATAAYSIGAATVVQLVALVFTASLADGARAAEAAAAEQVRRIGLLAEERAIAEDTTARFAELSRSLVPLLEQLRDAADPGEPPWRIAALIEQARLRRLFAQSNNREHVLVRDLGPAIAAAEDRGVAVTVDAGATLPEVDVDIRDRAIGIASMVLAGTATRARIVLTSTDISVSVSLVADVDDTTRDAVGSVRGVRIETAGELTWTDLDMPLTSPAPVTSWAVGHPAD